MSESLRRTLTISNQTENLSQVRTTVQELLEASPFEPTTRNKIVVAVDEALANVVEHAYQGDAGDIDLVFELDSEYLRVMIRDNGERFDPGERLDSPLDIQNHIKLGLKGGLGLFLMRQIMDDVQFAAGSEWVNELIMVKRVPSKDDG